MTTNTYSRSTYISQAYQSLKNNLTNLLGSNPFIESNQGQNAENFSLHDRVDAQGKTIAQDILSQEGETSIASQVFSPIKDRIAENQLLQSGLSKIKSIFQTGKAMAIDTKTKVSHLFSAGRTIYHSTLELKECISSITHLNQAFLECVHNMQNKDSKNQLAVFLDHQQFTQLVDTAITKFGNLITKLDQTDPGFGQKLSEILNIIQKITTIAPNIMNFIDRMAFTLGLGHAQVQNPDILKLCDTVRNNEDTIRKYISWTTSCSIDMLNVAHIPEVRDFLLDIHETNAIYGTWMTDFDLKNINSSATAWSKILQLGSKIDTTQQQAINIFSVEQNKNNFNPQSITVSINKMKTLIETANYLQQKYATAIINKRNEIKHAENELCNLIQQYKDKKAAEAKYTTSILQTKNQTMAIIAVVPNIIYTLSGILFSSLQVQKMKNLFNLFLRAVWTIGSLSLKMIRYTINFIAKAISKIFIAGTIFLASILSFITQNLFILTANIILLFFSISYGLIPIALYPLFILGTSLLAYARQVSNTHINIPLMQEIGEYVRI